MQTSPVNVATDPRVIEDLTDKYLSSSVSWSAIVAGALAMAALSFILMTFGWGVGLASVSPWPGASISPTSLTVMAAVWLIIVQWLSAGFGGYLSGRLRCKWVGTHTHEVFFRDTAHGFLAWSLATLISVGLLASTASHLLGNGKYRPAMPGTAPSHEEGMDWRGPLGDPFAIYVDHLLRSERADATLADPEARAESERILFANIKDDKISNADHAYLVQVVVTHTGLTQPGAEKRVDDVLSQEKNDETKVRQITDDARRAMAAVSIYAFLALMVGAFIASAAAALGGCHKDEGWGIPKTY